MEINYSLLYKKVCDNLKKNISVTTTLTQEIGYKFTSVFYKNISIKQRQKIEYLKSFNKEKQAEFKHLYLTEKIGANELAKKYKIRRKVALDYAKSINPDEYARSFKCHNRKLSRLDVTKILIERIIYGTLMKELAIKYNISESRISRICSGHDWKHVFQKVQTKYNNKVFYKKILKN